MQKENFYNNKKVSDASKNEWLRPVLFFYAKITGWVVGPVVLAILIGRLFLESTKNQNAFNIILGVAFLITIYGIYKEIKIYKKSLDPPSHKASEGQVQENDDAD